MPDLAAVLKEEIRRLAKKEARTQTSTTRQAVAQYRHEIARLKRQIQDQEKKIAFLENQEKRRLEQPQTDEEAVAQARFSPRSVEAQRERLGFSAADYARLVGVSAMTIYNWEKGKARPQRAQLATLVGLRGIGKKEALRRLELLDNG